MTRYLGIVIVFALCGCATPYQPRGFSGGYSDVQLDNNVFQVRFQGNRHTNEEKAADFTLLRSAEVTLSHGFKYFIIADLSNSTRKSTDTTPTYTTTNYTYGYGNANAQSITYGGDTYIISKPTTTDTIVCFKEKPDIQGLVYNAEFLIRSLKEEYGISVNTNDVSAYPSIGN